MVDLLLDSHADCSDGAVVLGAAYNGHVPVIERLIEAQVCPCTRASQLSVTHVHTCTRSLCLCAKANLEVRTKRGGDTALLLAAARGDADMVAALAVGGADLNAQNRLGYNALMMAVRQGW